MTLKEFDSLTIRDFENMAVRDEIREVMKQRNIEQGAWEETKKYQDMYIKEKKSKLSLNEMLDIMRKMLSEEDNWNCDMLVERIYEAQNA